MSTRTEIHAPATDSTITVDVFGTGERPFLLLHGGGGHATMTGFAALLAEHHHTQVLVPVHPGFGGTTRPAGITDVAALARTYIDLLEQLGHTEVTVLGGSFGGWLAAEIAVQGSPRIAGVVIVNGIGIEVEGNAPADLRGLSPAEIRALSFHDPAAAPVPPAANGAGPAPDLAALLAYTGPAMTDPTLRDRLAGVDLPVRVIWGESDRVVDLDFGKAYAAAIPGATFTPLPRSGHMPQVETPHTLLEALTAG